MTDLHASCCGDLRRGGHTFHAPGVPAQAVCAACLPRYLAERPPRSEMHDGTPLDRRSCAGCGRSLSDAEDQHALG